MRGRDRGFLELGWLFLMELPSSLLRSTCMKETGQRLAAAVIC
jgi:hypothetical protein